MTAKRGASGLSGILLVDKPSGLTSHDVVNRVRRALGERRVGHAGTLDPMATGLLVVLVGPATRLAPYLTAAEKTYEAGIVFGAQTDTDDAEGTVVATGDVPVEVADEAFAAQRVAALVGTHEQIPPAFSAIKRGGQTAYELARRGEHVELEARTVEVSAARLVRVVAEPARWDVELTVSKGTYIRSVARDLGTSLGTVAHLGALRRTRSGAYIIDDAVPLGRVEEVGAVGVGTLFTDPFVGLGLPVTSLSEQGAARVAAGAPLRPGDCAHACPSSGNFSLEWDGRLHAVYSSANGAARAEVVIPDGVSGGRR